RLAAVTADDGLDALRPLPAGLGGHAADEVAVDVDDLELGLVRRPHLVGRIEALLRDGSHARPSLVDQQGLVPRCCTSVTTVRPFRENGSSMMWRKMTK